MVEPDDQRLPPLRAETRDEVTPLAEHVDEIEDMKNHLMQEELVSSVMVSPRH